MCNRYWMEHQLDKLERVYGASRDPSLTGSEIDAEVYPKYRTAVIRNREGQRQIQAMYWALIPSWVKDEDVAKFSKPNNATGETITKNLIERKGMFYGPMTKQRCVLPCSGWCEWTGEKGKMVANRLSVKGQDVMSLAGLYTYREGFPGLSCTMITTAAEGKALEFHDRIPVVLLTDADVERWLDPASDPLELTALFKCVPDELLVVEQRPEDQTRRKRKLESGTFDLFGPEEV